MYADGQSLRAAGVGCGNVAGNHAEAYRALDGEELVGCCDVDPSRAAAFAARHAVGHATDDLDDLLDAGIDLVSVCTPHPTHERVATAAAARGAQVLCEKPIAVDLAAAARTVAACEQAGVALGVLFQRRFRPAAARIRRGVDVGVLGTPVLGHASVLLHRDGDYSPRPRGGGRGRPTAAGCS